jgi:hypothetical protein
LGSGNFSLESTTSTHNPHNPHNPASQTMSDPFGTTARTWHPSLSEHYKLPPDVYYPLVDDFMHDERYAKWFLGYKPWQLHCFGGPGCGKVNITIKPIIVLIPDINIDYLCRYRG